MGAKMCLSKLEAVYDKPSALIVDGWKEFAGGSVAFSPIRQGGIIKPALSFTNFGGAVKLDTWLVASEVRPPMNITASDGKVYKAGFHAYAEDKARSSVRRVYLRKITCIGDQDGKKALVAQEMYVPSDPNGWPPQPVHQAPNKVTKRTSKGQAIADRIRKKFQ
jgi:hypothetical protein